MADKAIADGAQVIVGPLRSDAANAAAVAARDDNVNVLAFSNNPTIAGGNVFVLGPTFDNTARRLVGYAKRNGRDRIAGAAGVREVLTTSCDLRNATPYIYETDGATWLANHALGEEVFGPLGLIVRVTGTEQMEEIAQSLDGQLTATLHLDEGDTALGQRLMPILERKAGRVLANGFPTGVEVSDAMVPGGPYPASTNFGATSVGTLAIRRFLRPVCYQNVPDALLPADLG